jgi:acylglycerol lipase
MVPAVRPEDMSEDPAVVEEYLKDPMIYKGNVKANTGNEILNVCSNHICPF